MSNVNQKHENKQEQKTIGQPTAPATPLELSDEELGQVVGGALTVNAALDNTTKPAYSRDPGL